jgi:hypothetical protein
MKPGDPDQLNTVVERLRDYWLTESRPPQRFVDFAASVIVSSAKKPPRIHAS